MQAYACVYGAISFPAFADLNQHQRLLRGHRGAGLHIVYKVVKAHGSLSTALADAKADLAKAEATVESLVTAPKKAV